MPIFFTDRDLGARKLPGILREAGLTVERHIDHFRPDAPDAEWLPVVAERGWIVLTNDKMMLRRPTEKDAIIRSKAAVIMLVGGHADMGELAHNFVNTYEKVEQFIKSHPVPFIAKVYRPNPTALVAEGKPGRIELKYPEDSAPHV